MSLIVRDPFDTLTPLRDAMNRLFEESFVGPRSELLTSQAFPVDIYETDDQHAYVVEATLPGTKPEHIQVTAVDNTLTIRVAEKQEEKVKRGNYVRRERYEGRDCGLLHFPPLLRLKRLRQPMSTAFSRCTFPKRRPPSQSRSAFRSDKPSDHIKRSEPCTSKQ
jgi:Molecular chaperone (small heat shock protein)